MNGPIDGSFWAWATGGAWLASISGKYEYSGDKNI
jgi:hypothetical protein